MKAFGHTINFLRIPSTKNTASERPPDSYTVAGRRERIQTALIRHARGEVWPGVVLADGIVIGQITVQDILLRAWRKGELGYWLGYPHHGHGHATQRSR